MSDGKQVDRRVRRTRKQLREALIQLILDKGYAHITVQDITDAADLSRATFYLHYSDKDELLTNSLEEMFNDLVEQRQIIMNTGDGKLPPALLAFRHAQEYSALYRVLLGERGVTYVMSRVQHYLAMQAEHWLKLLIPDDTRASVPTVIIAHHVAGSMFSLLIWWLENDMPHPPEHMAELFQTLALPGIFTVLGLPIPDLDELENFAD